jgi:hypothetical protein
MRASAEHSTALADAGLVAERAADHPGRGAALLPAALVVTHSATWQDVQVRPARQGPAGCRDGRTRARTHPAALEVLRTALVNAGDIDDART